MRCPRCGSWYGSECKCVKCNQCFTVSSDGAGFQDVDPIGHVCYKCAADYFRFKKWMKLERCFGRNI